MLYTNELHLEDSELGVQMFYGSNIRGFTYKNVVIYHFMSIKVHHINIRKKAYFLLLSKHLEVCTDFI